MTVYQCTSEEAWIEVTPQPEEGKIGIKSIRTGYSAYFCKTGVIPCSEGFEARVWLRVPWNEECNDWGYTYTALVAKSIPVGKCDS